jgi:hypothetical protein
MRLVQRLTCTAAAIALAGTNLTGCQAIKVTAKVAAAPVVITYKGAELTAKGFYYTGKYGSIGSYETAKFTGKGLYYAGKGAYEVGEFGVDAAYTIGKYSVGGVLNTMEMAGHGVRKVADGLYYLGSIPVRVTERALNTTDRLLRISVRIVDTAGRIVELAKDVSALQLESELGFLKNIAGIAELVLESEDEVASSRNALNGAQDAASRLAAFGR